jgi:hypothetical protein
MAADGSNSSISSKSSAWYMASSFTTDVAFNAFERIFDPQLSSSQARKGRTWKPESGIQDSHETPLNHFPWAMDPIADDISLQQLSETTVSLSGTNGDDAVVVAVSMILLLHSERL